MPEFELIRQFLWKEEKQLVPVKLSIDIVLILIILCILVRIYAEVKCNQKKNTIQNTRTCQTSSNVSLVSLSKLSVQTTSTTTILETKIRDRLHYLKLLKAFSRTNVCNFHVILEEAAKALDSVISEIQLTDSSTTLNVKKDLLEQNLAPSDNFKETNSLNVDVMELIREETAMIILSLGVKKGDSTLLLNTQCELVPPSTESSIIL